METMTYLTEATLGSGLRVAVRPLQPSDRDDLVSGFEQLSPESRYRRFLSGKPRLTATDISHLFGSDQIALVLVWPRTSCPDVVLGIAQAIPVPGRPGVAEFCIVVADEVQGCGAGRLLTEHLAAEAAASGIEHLTGLMLATNAAPARLMAGLGVVVEDRIHAGTRELTVRLS